MYKYYIMSFKRFSCNGFSKIVKSDDPEFNNKKCSPKKYYSIPPIKRTILPPEPEPYENISITDLDGTYDDSGKTYTLNSNTTITEYQILTIPTGQSLFVPTAITLINNGTIQCNGPVGEDLNYIVNGKFINNNIFTQSGGNVVSQSGGEIINSISGSINVESGIFYAYSAGDIITNNGTIKVSGVDSYLSSQLGSTFTNTSSGII